MFNWLIRRSRLYRTLSKNALASAEAVTRLSGHAMARELEIGRLRGVIATAGKRKAA